MYFDNCFGKTTIYLRIFTRNKNGNLHYKKTRKIDCYKTVGQFTIEPKKIKI